MDHWSIVGIAVVIAVCWTMGEVLIKAEFRPDFPQALIPRLRATGWASIRAAGIIPLVFAINQHFEIDKLRAETQRARAQHGIVDQVDHRMTAARPGFEITDPASGVVVEWHPPNETAVTEWRAH